MLWNEQQNNMWMIPIITWMCKLNVSKTVLHIRVAASRSWNWQALVSHHSHCQHGPSPRLFLTFLTLSAPKERVSGRRVSLKIFQIKSYQVSPFLSCVFNSAATSPLWVSRSAAPPSAIFTRTLHGGKNVPRHGGTYEMTLPVTANQKRRGRAWSRWMEPFESLMVSHNYEF